jgi:hypothetical protein
MEGKPPLGKSQEEIFLFTPNYILVSSGKETPHIVSQQGIVNMSLDVWRDFLLRYKCWESELEVRVGGPLLDYQELHDTCDAFLKLRDLQSLCDLGYSAMDIITTVFRVVRNYEMHELVKLEFIKVLQKHLPSPPSITPISGGYSMK